MYHYDGECLAKAEELGHPDIVSITQKQASRDLEAQKLFLLAESFLEGTRPLHALP